MYVKCNKSNSNIMQFIDEEYLQSINVFDPENRLTKHNIISVRSTIPKSVPLSSETPEAKYLKYLKKHF